MTTTIKKQTPGPESDNEISQREIQQILAKFSFLENNFNLNPALSECFLMNRLKLDSVHTKLADGMLEGIRKKLLDDSGMTAEMIADSKTLQKSFGEKYQEAIENSKAFKDFLESKVQVKFYKTTLKEIKGSSYHSETLHSLAKHILDITHELD